MGRTRQTQKEYTEHQSRRGYGIHSSLPYIRGFYPGALTTNYATNNRPVKESKLVFTFLPRRL
jgi:hypothetical protein